MRAGEETPVKVAEGTDPIFSAQRGDPVVARKGGELGRRKSVPVEFPDQDVPQTRVEVRAKRKEGAEGIPTFPTQVERGETDPVTHALPPHFRRHGDRRESLDGVRSPPEMHDQRIQTKPPNEAAARFGDPTGVQPTEGS